METNTDIIADPASAPYAKVRAWMTSDPIKLAKTELTAFALLFELAHPDGEDSQRITMEYLCECCELEPEDAFEVIQKLMKRGLVSFNMSSGGTDFIGNFTIDENGLHRALTSSGSAKRGRARETQQD